ncbi:hypothetical protein [Aquabacterium sp. OR-4]|uniref:hypothetical protein n=1 Tax=Aquabacterium sp. OR-4 TaxID=2978127 RepID=UPI0021B2689B|nr:hypothetical protein [Aquabacterium sp. OR-4]MDT7836325.1 hypothetical protein [Aquabacterium sp. OR-4]
MKHPVVIACGLGLLVLLVAAALPLLHMRDHGAAPPAGAGSRTGSGGGAGAGPAPGDAGLPWQVRVLADGSAQVFGLHLGRDTLAEAEARFGDHLQVALVARLGEVGALEALVDPMQAGFVSGRLVLAFEVPAATLQRWRAQVGSSSAMEGGVRRFKLDAADRQAARSAPLVGLSFVPALRLGEADLRERFGPPARVLGETGGAPMLLYPERGLAASVRAGERGVLQYVAPRDFAARLLAPLEAAGGQAAAAASAAPAR